MGVEDGVVVAVVGDGGQGFAAVLFHPEVGAFGYQGHAVVLDYGHSRAVHFVQDVGGDDAMGGAVGDDAAVEAHDAGQMHGHGVDFVGGEDDGDAGVVEVVEQVHHIVAGFDIHAGGGFVQQQEFGAAAQGAGQKDALLLPAGQLPDVPFRQVGDAQPFHHIVGQLAFLTPIPGEPGVDHRPPHQHGFLDGNGEVPIYRRQLRHIAGPVAAAARPVIDAHPPRHHIGGTQHGPQQRGLAGAAGSQQPHKIAGHHPQINIVQHGGAVVAGGNALQLHNGAGVRVGPVQMLKFGGMQHSGGYTRGAYSP